MTLGRRVSLSLINGAIVGVLMIVVVVLAIMTSVIAGRIKSEEKTAYEQMVIMTIALWVLFGCGVMFGIFVFPLMISIPYLFLIAMLILGISLLVMAGLTFKISAGTDKEKGTVVATGVIMLIVGLAIIVYGIIGAIVYHRMGGLKSDAGLLVQALAAPELGATEISPEVLAMLKMYGGDSNNPDFQKALEIFKTKKSVGK